MSENEEETRFLGKNLVSDAGRSDAGQETVNLENPSHPARAGSPSPGDPAPVLRRGVEPIAPETGVMSGEGQVVQSSALRQAQGDSPVVGVQVLPGFEGAVLDPLSEAQLRSEAARAIFEAGAEAAEPWMGDYWALLAEGWTWRQAVYMLWEAQPAEGRAPKTQGALAVEVLGLTSDRVIRTWKAENPAMGARIARLTASALGKARARVIRALIESAASANYRAHADRKLFLEMSGDYVPRQTLRVGPVMPDEMEEMSEEELRALAYEPGEGSGE